jgi:hypothetical protein
MNKSFTYSILKYHHSQLLGELLNVGILFSFNEGKELYFVTGNLQRLRSVYQEFDNAYISLVTKNIKAKLKERQHGNLFSPDFSLKDYVSQILLPEDSTALQFSPFYTSIISTSSTQAIIDEFSLALLPLMESKKEESRHNEAFILQKYTDFIIGKNINIDHRMRKNHPIQIKGVKLNFELSWKNGIVHLVKPLSFDLKEGQDILNKSATYLGYLNLLTEYAEQNDYNFDLLIAKPQDKSLFTSYEDALYNLGRSTAPKSLITEEKFVQYSEETATELHKKDL